MSAKFDQHFWGEGNPGYEVLLHNMKAGISASKELGEFIKERVSVEDSYVKGLTKLQKSVSHVPDSSLGAFAPMWQVLKEMCEKLSSLHSQFVQMLVDLAREISEYNITQKDKLKNNMKGEIDSAQDALQTLEGMDSHLHKSKKLYQQSCDQVNKLHGKLKKARADPAAPKAKQQLESRVKQAESWMEGMKGDHQSAVQRHCHQLMEFQGKMTEACQKFESLEEEHVAQMVTFMYNVSQIQEAHNGRVEEVYSGVHAQLDSLSVEKLLKDFVAAKGTGTEKPKPFKFKAISLDPSSHLNVSNEDLRSPSPTTGVRTSSRGEKGLRHRFKKKLGRSTKAPTVDVGANGPTGTSPTSMENMPEVDEEGYSIRPEDAASISQFPDDPRERREHHDSDSDTDSEDERDRKLKRIQIKTAPEQPTATVDDIKASVMTLKLGRSSPNIRKATSSQSLHTILTPVTPPTERRTSIGSSGNLAENTSASSLLDVDITMGTQMPAPLVPISYDPDILLTAIPDPTETLTPWTAAAARRSPNSTLPLLPTPTPSHTSSPTAQSSEVSRDTSPAPKPIPRRRTSSLHKHSLQKLSPELDRKEISGIFPPPLPSKRKSASTLNKSGSEELPSNIPSPIDETQSLKMSGSKQDTEPRLESSVVLTPPIPAPRRTTSSRRRPSFEGNTSISPLAITQRSAPSPTPPPNGPMVHVPPLPPKTPPTIQSVPIAVAFQETCHAVFKGTNLSHCVVKVAGEMVVSFPASYLDQLESHELLQFQLSGLQKVERLRHNQHLLAREGDSPLFKFNMSALSSHLRQMAEKHSAPFYNVQILKYEVGVTDGGQLPLKLLCYWKCEPTVTNFRLDYTFVSSSLSSHSTKHPPPLTNVVISVPMGGDVRNALSKPTGVWLGDQNKMVWTLGNLQPAEQPSSSSLQAKFEVSSGPSVPTPAVAQFLCEGATLSGMGLELVGSGYHMSLLKEKCTAGKYMAEIK